MNINQKSAFSLIELSIALVLIGLLVGGVLAGRTMIRASEIRSTITDLDTYKTAYNSFILKYNCVAGDCLKATSFFGAQDPTPATCQATASSGKLTCNGNGDALVNDGTWEMFRFWQQLAIAGYIKGKYTGVQGPQGIYHHVLGSNAPAAALPSSGWCFSYIHLPAGLAGTYAMNYGNMFWLGSTGAALNVRPQRVILTPSEAKDFDKKIDDGKPGTGLVIARSPYAWADPNACTTSTSATDYAGVYNTSVTLVNCAFMIKTGIYEN